MPAFLPCRQLIGAALLPFAAPGSLRACRPARAGRLDDPGRARIRIAGYVFTRIAR